jgi:hypothetical protein
MQNTENLRMGPMNMIGSTSYTMDEDFR